MSLRAKPPELLEASAKGTVPVLVVPRPGPRPGNGSDFEEKKPARVLEESLEIMLWALEHRDPQGWWAGRSHAARSRARGPAARVGMRRVLHGECRMGSALFMK